MATRARLSHAEIAQAKALAEGNGLRLRGYEKRPDGTIKLEFSDPEEQDNSNWFAGSPLYKGAA